MLPREATVRSAIPVAIGALAGLAALGAVYLGRVRTAAATLLVTVLAMVLARDQVRRAMLDIAGFTSSPQVSAQWDVIAIFAVLLVGALATTAWMVAISLRRPAARDSGREPALSRHS